MTWIVPLTLGGLAIAVMALFTILGARRGKAAPAQAAGNPGVSILVHDINDDRCTGCDACVAVCPTNVLDLVDNKSRVLRFHDCIQCEACMWACPTEALVMFREGSEPPPLKVPELDDSYQTAVPGQYLIGEVAGKPLVKNAANLGRGVVEHMLRTGLVPGAVPGAVDVAIVGSGPGGLSAALTCIQRGLSYVVLEKEQLIASTIARYPKGKLVMAEPYDTVNLSLLPVFDSSKEQIIPIWRELIERVGLHINQGEAVESATRRPDGSFDVRTTVAAYRAQRLVLATGTRGKPRTLQVPGENLPKVTNLLDDPDDWRGKDVLVVGGGDSAVEAALALADAGARVIISYRGKSFNRAQPKNKQAIESYAQQQRLKAKVQSQVVAFEPESVILALADGSQKRYPNAGAFVLIGADPPVTWLEKLGVRFVLRPHQYALGKSDDFVRRLLSTATECPQDPAAAAMAVTGRDTRLPSEVERALSSISLPEPVSGPKKWIRAATGLFGTGARKIEQPMPLSEFARRQRTHAGQGRRDQLSAGERTRVLRMLRDEGGRIADEESKVSFVDLAALRAAPPARDPTPPPQPRVQRVAGAPPPPPPSQDDLPAKQAVIVGLAKAHATGPRTRSKRPSDEVELGPGVRMKPGKGPRPPVDGSPPPEPPRSQRAGAARPAPMFLEEATRQIDPSQPLPEAAIGGRPLRRGPERIADDFRLDDPTRAADVDPRLLARAGDDDDLDPLFEDAPRAPSTLDDGTLDDLDFLSATHQGDGANGSIDLGPREQSRRYPKLEDEDATRMGDMRDLLARERERVGASGAGATSRKKPETREPPRSGRGPAAPPGPVGHDDATRAVDVSRDPSLSDIDWDLD
ncbi:MAG: NAD(P)-binding domain-containing protein [Kofleriaceae bacterium]|nr:NAD(P)-binding domain-containing protein [Kofleriaceae bacterium]MCL4227479.1 NAD(P)-binding domain-containing protein [Myxococcales bacterium]